MTGEKAIQKMSEIGTKELKSVSEGVSVTGSLEGIISELVKMSSTYKELPYITHTEFTAAVSKLVKRDVNNPQVHQWLSGKLKKGIFIRVRAISKTGRPAWHYKLSEDAYKAMKSQTPTA